METQPPITALNVECVKGALLSSLLTLLQVTNSRRAGASLVSRNERSNDFVLPDSSHCFLIPFVRPSWRIQLGPIHLETFLLVRTHWRIIEKLT